MAIHHELDLTGRNSAQGQSAETEFIALARAQGYAVRMATPHEDRIKHFDCVLLKDGKSIRVEIKSKKSFCIWHKEQRTPHHLLIELVGVTGYEGWIYGEADLIAYQQDNGFWLISRKYLLSLALEKCGSEWVDHRENMLYKNYGREDRCDQVTAILISDLQDKTKYCFWRKI